MEAKAMTATRILTSGVCKALFQPAAEPMLRRHFAQAAVLSQDSSNVPRVASPSFWHSLIPKPFRRPDDPVSLAERQKQRASRSNEWNPATFFIAMALLVGSNAINSIALKRERLNFTRRTDAKLDLLRETIERVRKGENVNVDEVLGTGNPEQEQGWEEVLKEIERDDALWQTKKKKKAQKHTQEPEAQQQPPRDLSFTSLESPPSNDASPIAPSESAPSESTPRRPGFY